MVEEVWRQAMDTGRRNARPFTLYSARTRTIHRPVGPVAYDCVKVIIVRDGSAILFSEFGQKPVTAT
jgi:AraC family transcriptional regulator